MSDQNSKRPNVIVILADDMGYSDLGCYGGEIRTPNLDALAGNGVRMTNFYNTPRCSPSRASLLTGLHPHQAGIGILAIDDSKSGGYKGTLNDKCITMAEALKGAGYATAVRGKWHLSNDVHNPNEAWPLNRGFDSFYGTLTGCGSYFQPGTLTRNDTNVDEEALDEDFYYTDRITEEAVSFLNEHHQTDPGSPFFLYVPYTAPHWPLHAREEDIAKYDGAYDEGWDVLRERRMQRLLELGILPENVALSDRDPVVSSWEDETEKEWQARRMQVYAAQIEVMDRGIGRIIETLKTNREYENTIVIFLSDNGAAAEPVPLIDLERFRKRADILKHHTKDGRRVVIGNDSGVMPGADDTYSSYGRSWANLSNTPFRLFKIWTHEGGISSPFIFHWPNGELAEGSIRHNAHQLVDVMPTILEATGAQYPTERNGVAVHPLTGQSMLADLRGEDGEPQTLFWEHCGNAAILRGEWKLVRQHGWPWELYNLREDRSETRDLASQNAVLVKDLEEEWSLWADSAGVIPFDKTLEIYHQRGLGWTDAIG